MAYPDRTIIKLALPTPWPVGDVNVYFIDGPEPVLVDTGVRSSKSLKALGDQLAAHGRRLGEVRHIVVTHGHYDHAGAAHRLSRDCDATLYLHEKNVLEIRREMGTMEVMSGLLVRCGFPKDLLDQTITAFSHEVRFADIETAPHRVEFLKDGQTITIGGLALEVIATPGHSPDHLCYRNPATGALFSGDMLLPHITPNPLLYLDPDNGFRRYRSLIDYMASLDRLSAYQLSAGYPGHGRDIDNVPALIAHSREFVQKRKEIFRKKIAGGASTPWALARAVFGELDLTNSYLAVSEAIAHLDLLERGGDVVVYWDGATVTAQAVTPRH